MNDYSGSLALQSGGIRIRRQWSALIGTVFAFFLILWLNHGDTSAKFENVLLFASYWIAPFLAVILIDWIHVRSSLSEQRLRALMDFSRLATGWSAAVALVVGFLAMIPFMDTNLVYGALSKKLDGADISFYVGFVVAGIVYQSCAGWKSQPHRSLRRRTRWCHDRCATRRYRTTVRRAHKSATGRLAHWGRLVAHGR